MSKNTPKNEEASKVEDPEPEFEDRIDEYAIQNFEALGYTGRLPGSIVATYKRFKLDKDKIHPGRLTPEGFVSVVFFAGLFAGDKSNG